MARWVSAVLTARRKTGLLRARKPQASAGDRLLVRLAPLGFLLQRVLADAVDRKVRDLEHLADFDFPIDERHAPGPGQGFVLGFDVDDPEARDQLLGFGERPVDDARLAALEGHAGAVRAGLQAVHGEQYAGVDQLVVVA